MGDRIDFRDGRWVVPDRPVIPFIEGDGTGPDIWRASRRVFDSVIERVSGGKRRVEWLEVLAGEKAFQQTGSWLPEATLEAIRRHRVAIKGPLTTPVGGGIRSLNVALRQLLDLYACIRPVRYFTGAPSPMREPEKLDVVVYRENTEDVYTGVEYAAGTPEASKLLAFLRDQFGAKIRDGSALGIKPMSRFRSQRLVGKADGYAVFEATHGTAPKYAGLDKVNPGAVILSGAMMFEELGWTDAADAIVRGLSGAIAARRVTYDLARQMPGATEVSTSRFAECIIEHV